MNGIDVGARGSTGLQRPTLDEVAAQARVAELIAELDRVAATAWPGARTPPGAVVVAYCAWCATGIETGDGRQWRHTAPTPPSGAEHVAEPTRTRPPVLRAAVANPDRTRR